MPYYKRKETIEDYNTDDDTEAHEKLIAPADWDGPVGKDGRSCTDLLCLLLLIASWAAMTWIGMYAIANGDYRYIVYPMDYDGNVCGTNSSANNINVSDFPLLYYVNSYTGGVCVKECPTLMGLTQDNVTDVRTLITYNGIWQTEGAELDPNDIVRVANYSASSNALSCTEDLCFPNNSNNNSSSIEESWTSPGIARGFGFAYYVGDTYELFGRCYLTSEAETRIAELVNSGDDNNNALVSLIDPNTSSAAFFTHLYGDLWTARYIIVGFGFGGSLAVSLLYMILLRIPCLLSSLVWSSILAMISLFAIAGYYTYDTAQSWQNNDNNAPLGDQQIQYTFIASYVLYGIAAVLVLLACCLRSQIQLAIGCVKEAGKAINSMVLILFVPFLQGIGFFCFVAIWTYYSVHLASLGSITTQQFPLDMDGTQLSIRVYEFDDFVEQCGWYLLFCFYWTASFIVAVGDMTVAMAFSKWYFYLDKKGVNSTVVLHSLMTTLAFHLGTCAFGSLIIAIIQILRSLLAKIQKQVAKATNESIANCVLCCCQCCLCCLEKCMKFINKNAYIQTAIFGTSFLPSARKAFFLILRNAGRIGAVSYVSAAVLILGKLCISSVTTIASYYYIVEYSTTDTISDLVDPLPLYSYGGPVALIFVVSYVVADMFMDVFEIGILAILHCFVADEEMFGGRPRYAEGGLTAWVDQHGAHKNNDE